MIARFLAVYIGLIGGYFLLTLAIEFRNQDVASKHPWVSGLISVNRAARRYAITPYQEAIAAVTANTLTLLGHRVTVEGREIRADHFAVLITGGCDGLELTILLSAAVLAFPMGFRWKLTGLMAGAVAIACLNHLRVVSLWMVGIHWPAGFEIAHFCVWPFLMLCATIAIFLGWLRQSGTSVSASGPPADRTDAPEPPGDQRA